MKNKQKLAAILVLHWVTDVMLGISLAQKVYLSKILFIPSFYLNQHLKIHQVGWQYQNLVLPLEKKNGEQNVSSVTNSMSDRNTIRMTLCTQF